MDRHESLESALRYLRDEHAKTLAGLHKQIRVLQERNSELTMTLAMSAGPNPVISSDVAGDIVTQTVTDQQVDADNLENVVQRQEEEFAALNAELTSQCSKQSQLERIIMDKDDEIKQLRRLTAALQLELDNTIEELTKTRLVNEAAAIEDVSPRFSPIPPAYSKQQQQQQQCRRRIKLNPKPPTNSPPAGQRGRRLPRPPSDSGTCNSSSSSPPKPPLGAPQKAIYHHQFALERPMTAEERHELHTLDRINSRVRIRKVVPPIPQPPSPQFRRHREGEEEQHMNS